MARTNDTERILVGDLDDIHRYRNPALLERCRRFKIEPSEDALGRFVLTTSQAHELLRREAEEAERNDREYVERIAADHAAWSATQDQRLFINPGDSEAEAAERTERFERQRGSWPADTHVTEPAS